MLQLSKHLSAIYLAFLCIAAGIPRYQMLEATSMDVLENDWFTFQCDYDQSVDKKAYHELGVTVQECSKGLDMVMYPVDFKLVAAVFGRITAQSDEMKARFMNNTDMPVYYANYENEYVKSGLVNITDGSLTSITINIKATTRSDRICAFCAQTKAAFSYSLTKKVSLKIRSPPTVALAVNSVPAGHNERVNFELNQTARIACTAHGPDSLSVKLFKDNQELSSLQGSNLVHDIHGITRSSAGTYKCEATTDLPFLVDMRSNVAITQFVLAVRFAPEFELSEITRYTKFESQENIKISVSAYPMAEFRCKSSASSEDVLGQRESFDDNEVQSTYQLVLSNLDSVSKETLFECFAKNDVGERKLNIRLTAKAPIPQILSDGKTTWHNSYQLQWQHDQNADIDYYQVEIVHIVNGETVNTSTTKFDPKAQKGKMALVDGKRVSGQIVHSGVLFGLNPNSQHAIRLQSCNQHGCSDFSSPVNVQTPGKTDQNFNDPNNPEKNNPLSSGSLRASFASVAAACLFCASLLQQDRHQL